MLSGEHALTTLFVISAGEESKLTTERGSESGIVGTVLHTIRDLATRLCRQEELKECPICGDTVTGKWDKHLTF